MRRGLTRPALDHGRWARAHCVRSLLLRSSTVAGSILLLFCPSSHFLPRFHRKDLQHQKTLKQTKILDNNTAKGLTNINKRVRLSTKQHSSKPQHECIWILIFIFCNIYKATIILQWMCEFTAQFKYTYHFIV